MYTLNLPTFGYKLKKADGKVLIFDVVRKKYVVLTPEEWVRQHFINYVIQDLQYPKALLRIEGGLLVNQLQKRSDILVFNREGQAWMIIECKSPELKLSPSTLQQVSAYNSSIRAKYITVTNGLLHLCDLTDWRTKESKLLDQLPAFGS